jgi:outer membrane protein assembly factor BamB
MALAGKIRVIPVRVGGAPLPTTADLPDELQDLIKRQDFQLRDDTWDQDVDRLERQLRGKKDDPGGRSRRVRVLSLAAGVAVPALLAGFYFLMPRPGPVTCSAAHHAWPAKGLGPVYSHPAVANGRVYVASGNGNVYALNASTGAICWRYNTRTGVYSSPWLSGGALYVGGTNGNVYALNARSGQRAWVKHVGALNQSFVLDNATKDIYIGGDNGTVYSLNITTRKPAWKPFPTGSLIDASPVFFKNTVYACNHSGILYALNASTGKFLWKFRAMPAGETGYCAPTVESNTGTVYVAASYGISDGQVYALSPNGRQVWPGHFSTSELIRATPALGGGGGIVYVGTYDGHVYALNAQTGKKVWVIDLNHSIYRSGLIQSGNLVYVSTHDGHVYGLDALNKLAIQWRCNIVGMVESTPNFSNNMLYIGSRSGLVYGLDLSKNCLTGYSDLQ